MRYVKGKAKILVELKIVILKKDLSRMEVPISRIHRGNPFGQYTCMQIEYKANIWLWMKLLIFLHISNDKI